MTGCTHTKYEEVDEGYEDWDGNWQPDIRVYEVGTYEDVDLHRFRCTQCGKIRYYSSRAEAFYEEGKGELP